MGNFKSWNSYSQFASSIRGKARYIQSPENNEFLNEVSRTSKKRVKTLPAGMPLWRARIGHDTYEEEYEGKKIREIPDALSQKEMKPLKSEAREGRANPEGIPVLYLSTLPETAMSEVRPWIGSWVSCARFETIRDLSVVDFTMDYSRGISIFFKEPKPSSKEDAVWATIGQAFTRPVTPEEGTADYAPTQVISEMFKNEGFDGIVYKSSFGKKGYNIALFDLDDAHLTMCALHCVKSVKFKFFQLSNPYFVRL